MTSMEKAKAHGEGTKNEEGGLFLFFFILGVSVGLASGLILGIRFARKSIQSQAIENGAMYYSPLTGEPTWVKRQPVQVREHVKENVP